MKLKLINIIKREKNSSKTTLKIGILLFLIIFLIGRVAA